MVRFALSVVLALAMVVPALAAPRRRSRPPPPPPPPAAKAPPADQDDGPSLGRSPAPAPVADDDAVGAGGGGGGKVLQTSRSGGPTRVEFDDRLVQGQSNKKGAIYLFERKESALRSMLRKRKNFRAEIADSIR